VYERIAGVVADPKKAILICEDRGSSHCLVREHGFAV
jgi:hypothetical protein